MGEEPDGLTFTSGESRAFIPSSAYAGGRFKLWLEILPEEASGNSGWVDIGEVIRKGLEEKREGGGDGR